MSIKRRECLQTLWSKFLGRLWRREGADIQLRMKPHCIDAMLGIFELTCFRAVRSPAWGPDLPLETLTPLTPYEQQLFMFAVGKLAWMLPVRLEVSFYIQELARQLQNPNASSVAHLKHVLRYVKGSQSFVLALSLNPSEAACEVSATTDAGMDGRSTFGGTLWAFGVLPSAWGKTQPTFALSSCEAEIKAMSSAAAEGLQARSLFEELCVLLGPPQLDVEFGSSSVCFATPWSRTHEAHCAE